MWLLLFGIVFFIIIIIIGVPYLRASAAAATAAQTVRDQLAQRQLKLDARIAGLNPESKLIPIMKDVKVISCSTPIVNSSRMSSQNKLEREAVVAFPNAQFEIKWTSKEYPYDQWASDSFSIRNLATDEILFDGDAHQTSVHRGESFYFISIAQGVNELSSWLTAHGVDDCQQVDEPPWSASPAGTIRHPSRDDDDYGGDSDEDSDSDSDCFHRHPEDPDRNPEPNNLHRFLVTLCEGLFDQTLDDDMMTGMDGSLLYTIIFNQRPTHWNN